MRSTQSSWPSPTCRDGSRASGSPHRFFLDEVLEHGTEGCNYLLAVDTEMNTVDGYEMSSWDRGYGDFAMHPDLTTLRRVPWNEGTALLVADLAWNDGSPVVAAPRQILRRQLERLAEHGFTAHVGTELEFIVFKDTYEQAWDRDYRGLTPANQYNIDYSVLGTGRIEPLLRRIRNEMAAAGLTVESAKGECNPGQHEIAFQYDEALVTCDQHAVYKTGAKEIAAQEGVSLTFMAKYNEREGNSCHIHLSLQDADGTQRDGGRRTRRHVAGHAALPGRTARRAARLLAAVRAQHQLLQALPARLLRARPPSPGATTTAPARCASSATAAPCASRTGCPAATSTRTSPSPAWSPPGCTASSSSWNSPSACAGNAYTAEYAHVPTTLREAAELWENSPIAKAAFGDEVVAHYRNMARVELDAFDAAVTDWELRRSFERL